MPTDKSKLITDYLISAFRDKQTLVDLADRKANIIIGLIGIILSLFFNVVVQDLSYISIQLAIVILPFIISGFFAFLVFFPRLPRPKEKFSFINFASVAKSTPETISKWVEEITEDRVSQDIAENLQILSRTLILKFTYLKIAYVFLALAVTSKILYELWVLKIL